MRMGKVSGLASTVHTGTMPPRNLHVKREELSPTALRIFDARRGYGSSGHYWLQSEVEAETEHLAEQLTGA
jgi:hypothetical protein